MKKSFLNKFKKLRPKTESELQAERKLLPRLQFMGYIMIGVTIASFIFALMAPQEPGEILEQDMENLSTAGLSLNDEDEMDLSAREVLNFYLVSLIFAGVGASCFLISWKKKKKLI